MIIVFGIDAELMLIAKSMDFPPTMILLSPFWTTTQISTFFLLYVCFFDEPIVCMLFLPVQQIMIVDLKLTYPSGLATAVLINGFHSQGDKMARYTSSIVLMVERMILNNYKFYYISFTIITLTDVLKEIVNKS